MDIDYTNRPNLLDLMSKIKSAHAQDLANENAQYLPDQTQAQTGLTRMQTEQMPKQTAIQALQAITGMRGQALAQMKAPSEILANTNKGLPESAKAIGVTNNAEAIKQAQQNAAQMAAYGMGGNMGNDPNSPANQLALSLLTGLKGSINSNLPNAGTIPAQGAPAQPNVAMSQESSGLPVQPQMPAIPPGLSPEAQLLKTTTLSDAQKSQLSPTQLKQLPYAANIEKTLTSMDQFAPQAMKMAGNASEMANQMKRLAAGQETSPEFNAYKAFATQGTFMVKQLRQAYGDSIQPSAQEKLAALQDIKLWFDNPQLAMQNFKIAEALARQEMQTTRTPISELMNVSASEKGQKNTAAAVKKAVEYSNQYGKGLKGEGGAPALQQGQFAIPDGKGGHRILQNVPDNLLPELLKTPGVIRGG